MTPRMNLSHGARGLLDLLETLDPQRDSIDPRYLRTHREGIPLLRGLLDELEESGFLWRKRGAPPRGEDGRAAGGARKNWGLLNPPDADRAEEH